MKNLNLNLNFAAFILIALFAFTSCQKENMAEMTAQTTTDVSERNLPADGINVVYEEVRTEASAKKFRKSAQSRNKGYKEISCGFDYDGCTIRQGNSVDYRHYPSDVDALAAFDGEDEYFFFEVEATPGAIMTYDISLTELTTDLDLFVFALNSNYQITATKAMSINSYNKDEKITIRDLAPGLYIVAVDAYRSGLAGHYNLTMDCSAVSDDPPSVSAVEYIVTNFGTCYNDGDGYWTFIGKDSDMAIIFEETSNNGNNISIQNVFQVGATTTTTNIYLGLDNKNAAREITTETGNATSISDEFGYITHIEYSN